MNETRFINNLFDLIKGCGLDNVEPNENGTREEYSKALFLEAQKFFGYEFKWTNIDLDTDRCVITITSNKHKYKIKLERETNEQ
jgi:hypothetical protein